MREVLESMVNKITESKIIEELGLEHKKYFLVSIHREENVDNPDSLKSIIKYLLELKIRYDFPIIISTHPRTKDRIKKLKLGNHFERKLSFLKPFGFIDYNKLTAL